MDLKPLLFRAVITGAAMLSHGALPAMAQQKDDGQSVAIAYYCDSKDLFDYLLGDWEFTGLRKSSSQPAPVPIRGLWSAARSAEGPLVVDEFRMLDDSARTIYVSTTFRALSLIDKRWNIVSIEPFNGLPQSGSAWKEGADILVEQTFNSGATSSLWRIRYYDIQPNQFSWRADRSSDGGKTWVANHMTMDVRRTGPRKSLPALTTARVPLTIPTCN